MIELEIIFSNIENEQGFLWDCFHHKQQEK